MKTPTKADLYNQIEALEQENIKLQHKLEEEERKKWIENAEKAMIALKKLLPFPTKRVVKVTLEHIDRAGYWFTFELDNDNRRQTFAVRHSDI